MLIQFLLALFLVTNGVAHSVEPRPPVPKEISPTEVWFLTFGEGEVLTLESKDYPYFNSDWKFVNQEYWGVLDSWEIGQQLIIFPVIAESSNNSKEMVGYMLFAYNDLNNGYWVTHAIHTADRSDSSPL